MQSQRLWLWQAWTLYNTTNVQENKVVLLSCSEPHWWGHWQVWMASNTTLLHSTRPYPNSSDQDSAYGWQWRPHGLFSNCERLGVSYSVNPNRLKLSTLKLTSFQHPTSTTNRTNTMFFLLTRSWWLIVHDWRPQTTHLSVPQYPTLNRFISYAKIMPLAVNTWDFSLQSVWLWIKPV